MNPRRVLLTLLAVGLVLLIVGVAILATGRLLAAMGDETGALVLDRIALAAAALFAVNLVALVVVNSYLLLRLWDEATGGE